MLFHSRWFKLDYQIFLFLQIIFLVNSISNVISLHIFANGIFSLCLRIFLHLSLYKMVQIRLLNFHPVFLFLQIVFPANYIECYFIIDSLLDY